jgi:Putative bacterial sensory transduction regulator
VTEDRVAALAAVLEAAGVDYAQPQPGSFAVQLPGQRRLKTTCWLIVGDHAVQVEAFVMRRPDENVGAVHAFLLQRNARMYAVSWSIDGAGDVYLTGRLPFATIEAAEIDRVLGAVLEYADGTFNTLLELGFGSSIRREWAWRVKTGESLANLAPFADFVQRTTGA